jgi:histone-lysine N-methyltransferase SETMAR
MNNDYFVTNLFTPLEQSLFPQEIAPHEKRLVFHADNCSIQTSRVSTELPNQQNIVRMPRPPYSPDLAPSDFYLFPTVKKSFNKLHCATKTNSLNA